MVRILTFVATALLLVFAHSSAGWAQDPPPGPAPEPPGPAPEPEPPEPEPEPDPPEPDPEPEPPEPAPEPAPPEPPGPSPEPHPEPQSEPEPASTPAPPSATAPAATGAAPAQRAAGAPITATAASDERTEEADSSRAAERETCRNCPSDRDLEPYWAIGLGASTFSGVGFLIRRHANEHLAVQFTGGVISTTGEESSTLFGAGLEIQGTIRRGVRSRIYVTGGAGAYGEHTSSRDYMTDELVEHRTTSISFGLGLGGELSLGQYGIRDNVSLGLSFHPIEYRAFIERTRETGDRQISPGAAFWATYNF